MESIETVGSDFAGVVVGRGEVCHIRMRIPAVVHGRLWSPEPMRVVCGAPNVVVDGVYPLPQWGLRCRVDLR